MELLRLSKPQASCVEFYEENFFLLLADLQSQVDRDGYRYRVDTVESNEKAVMNQQQQTKLQLF